MRPAPRAITAAALDLSTLDGAAGFTLYGVAAGDYSGFSVAHASDINGDGVDDLLVAAYTADPGGRVNAGSTYVVYGRAAPCPGDANGDRVVDMLDLNTVLIDYNLVGPGLPGDVDHDGDCDFFDLNTLLTNFGTAC